MSPGHLNGNQNIPGIGRYTGGVVGVNRLPGKVSTGIPFPIVLLSVSNTGASGFGAVGTHQKI